MSDETRFRLPTNYINLHWKERQTVRNQYIVDQGGLCFYCKNRLDLDAPKKVKDKRIDWSLFPKGFINHPIHLQHDHKTGMTQGAVHAYCNAVMWQYEGQ